MVLPGLAQLKILNINFNCNTSFFHYDNHHLLNRIQIDKVAWRLKITTTVNQTTWWPISASFHSLAKTSCSAPFVVFHRSMCFRTYYYYKLLKYRSFFMIPLAASVCHKKVDAYATLYVWFTNVRNSTTVFSSFIFWRISFLLSTQCKRPV